MAVPGGLCDPIPVAPDPVKSWLCRAMHVVDSGSLILGMTFIRLLEGWSQRRRQLR